MRNHLKFFFSLILINSFTFGQVQFESISFEEAIVKASQQGKKVFIDVYTTWCGPCKSLDANIFSNKEIGERMAKEYICLKVDYEKSPYRKEISKYYIKGYPTMLILDGKGLEIGRIYGYRGLTSFHEELNQFENKKYHPVTEAIEAMKLNPDNQLIWKKSLTTIGADYNLLQNHQLIDGYIDSCKTYFEKFEINSIKDDADLQILSQVTLPISHPAVQSYLKDSIDYGSYMHQDYAKQMFKEEIKNAKTKEAIESLKKRAKEYYDYCFKVMYGDMESYDYFINNLFTQNQLNGEYDLPSIQEEEKEPSNSKKSRKQKNK